MTDPLSTLLSRSREIAERATPGPWRVGVVHGETMVLADEAPLWDCPDDEPPIILRADDADHIAQASPSTWLALLDVADRLQDCLTMLRCVYGEDGEDEETLRLLIADGDAALSRLAEKMGGTT